MMLHVGGGGSRGTRRFIFGLVAVVAVFTVAADPADARRNRGQTEAADGRHASHRVSHHSIRESGYSPAHSSIVIDANSGRTLEEENADSPRHPASLTKVMTLYLLFERLDAGRMKLGTLLPVSEHAAAQAPTKLGLRPGQSLEVEDAIRGIVTRSANDAAVVVAEAIGGDEESFAKLMTAKAHALGMSRTTYHNASGLPDDAQVTTARDQAVLGRAIQERFPRYYRYFATRSFVYHGEEIRNHNHLLGQVEGVDGIKTGYTRASGFNLVTSVRRDNRHLVAVVMGGNSAGARDARMRTLIEEHIAKASVRHTAPLIAEAAEPVRPNEPAPINVATRSLAPPAPPSGYSLATVTAVPTPPPAAGAPVQGPVMVSRRTGPAMGSTEPIRPIAVKTVKVKMAPIRAAALEPAPFVTPIADEAAAAPAPAPVSVRPVAEPTRPAPAAKSEPAKDVKDAPPAVLASAAPSEPLPQVAARVQPSTPARSEQVRTGWIIQIGAFDSESEARQHLDAAQSKAKNLLGHADPFTEAVTKGDKTFYRARFAGLEKGQAEASCRQLRRNEIACMTVKN